MTQKWSKLLFLCPFKAVGVLDLPTHVPQGIPWSSVHGPQDIQKRDLAFNFNRFRAPSGPVKFFA